MCRIQKMNGWVQIYAYYVYWNSLKPIPNFVFDCHFEGNFESKYLIVQQSLISTMLTNKWSMTHIQNVCFFTEKIYFLYGKAHSDQISQIYKIIGIGNFFTCDTKHQLSAENVKNIFGHERITHAMYWKKNSAFRNF